MKSPCTSTSITILFCKTGLGIFLSLLVFFIPYYFTDGNSAFAESKQTLPKIDENDFSFFTDKNEKITGQDIYLYSSLSIMNLEKDAVVFEITREMNPHTFPLSTLKSYPPINTEIQSEYFDVTIWGQLENYFNKNIELIELETEIRATMRELEQTNEKYKALTQNHNYRFNPDYTVTLNRFNYFYVNSTDDTQKNPPLKSVKKDSNNSSASNLTDSNDAGASATRLHNEVFTNRMTTKEQAESASKNITKFSKGRLSVQGKGGASQRSTWADFLFNIINDVINYFFNHPIVSMIYLFFILFFFRFLIKIIFRI